MPYPLISSDCDCDGVPPGLSNVPVQFSSSFARRFYAFAFLCAGVPVHRLKYTSGQWERQPVTGETAWELVLEIDGDPVECRLIMTANGTTPGGVEIVLERAAGGVIAIWENIALWQPHIVCQMKLVFKDLTCKALRINPYPCLLPSMPLPPECDPYSDTDQVVSCWRVQIPAHEVLCRLVDGGTELDAETFTLFPTFEILCLPLEEYDSIDPAAYFGGTCWYRGQIIVRPGVNWTPGVPEGEGFLVQIDSFRLTVDVGGGLQIHVQRDQITPLNTPALPAGEWHRQDPDFGDSLSISATSLWDGTANPVWSYGTFETYFTLVNEDEGEQVPSVSFPVPPAIDPEDPHVLTAAAVLGANPDPASIPCNPLPAQPAANCGGAAKWRLNRKCYDGTQGKYWLTLLENNCRGQCGEGSCVPDAPVSIPVDEFIDDETAESMGLLDLLAEGDFWWECKCGTAGTYTEPDCPVVCEGGCDYVIAGYTSENGTFGTQSGSLTIEITSDGTSGGTHVGYVYLNVSSNYCSGDGCSCPGGTKYSTSLAYWGIGGFPSSSVLVGSPGGTFDCE